MSDSFLHFGAVLASYFLRVAAAYGVCWLLSRLSASPRRRFLIWLLFLVGAAGYWFLSLLPASFHVSAGAAISRLPVHSAALTGHNLVLPADWAPALAMVGPILALAYALGVLLFFSGMLWQHLSLRRALRHALEPSPELTSLFHQMCHGFDVRRCDVQILPQLSSPATAGWLRPRILLPEICEQFTESSELADVLYHELVHVARRDYLWAAVSDLARCLLFFHPAVWRARQHMRVQRELACDVVVVSGRPEHRADYAQSLTRFARLRMLKQGKAVGIDFAASASILGMRVRAVLNHYPRRRWWRSALYSALSAALLISFGVLWPGLGIAAQFAAAPQFIQPESSAPPLVAQTRRYARVHTPPRRRRLLPQVETQPAPAIILPPVARQSSTPSMPVISSAELGPQSDDLAEPEEAPVTDNGDPTWSETLPLPRAGNRMANVVQRVATGLAQIGRQEIGREGHDRSGRW